MNEEWVPVTEDLPQQYKKYSIFSVNVRILFADRKTAIGYYDFRRRRWVYNNAVTKKEVVAWQSL